MFTLPVPQEDSYRRRKGLGPLEDWRNLTSKYLEKLQQRKKSEFQGGEWVPWEQEGQEEEGGGSLVSRGEDSARPLQGVRARSLPGAPRS